MNQSTIRTNGEPEYKMGPKGEPESFVNIVALLLQYSLARKTAAK